MAKLERTLVVLKPDSVGRSIVWEIISRFERAGLHIVGVKMVSPNADFFKGHYEWIGQLWTRKWEVVLKRVVNDMMASPVLAIVLEGVEVIQYVRKMVGSTEPKAAAPGTIRGDFAHISYAYVDNNPGASVYNLVHASADENEAAQEIAHRFKEEELFDYQPLHHPFTR